MIGIRRIGASRNPHERKALAEKGKPLDQLLPDVLTIVQPATSLKWHRQLVALKWNFSRRRKAQPGRPSVAIAIEKLMIQFARENACASSKSRARKPADVLCELADTAESIHRYDCFAAARDSSSCSLINCCRCNASRYCKSDTPSNWWLISTSADGVSRQRVTEVIDPQSVKLTVPQKLAAWAGAMTEVFHELHRILKPGGHVAFEVGEVRRGKIRL